MGTPASRAMATARRMYRMALKLMLLLALPIAAFAQNKQVLFLTCHPDHLAALVEAGGHPAELRSETPARP